MECSVDSAQFPFDLFVLVSRRSSRLLSGPPSASLLAPSSSHSLVMWAPTGRTSEPSWHGQLALEVKWRVGSHPAAPCTQRASMVAYNVLALLLSLKEGLVTWFGMCWLIFWSPDRCAGCTLPLVVPAFVHARDTWHWEIMVRPLRLAAASN